MIRETKLIPKIMTSQTGEQTIAIHILSYILRSKHNQIMKFAQLIEYNKINVFLQNYAEMRQRD